ncbi:MAM and LDL-receptor class A domain-containing protein 2-like isoform X2 [Aethina tumida]|uniref:MAM and LDL-receptor class A domain-containing protein 2-like isoform X2 n=1 Tax=Aethina tumida TaxID=116153 RepID=UPI002147ED25|nr:MAM and LDL-receptor class A domain-containing protein 2-like isoform X2 [Aethina tumida]
MKILVVISCIFAVSHPISYSGMRYGYSGMGYGNSDRKMCQKFNLANGLAIYRQRHRLAKFKCNSGYNLLGDKFVQCIGGQWQFDAVPICVKNSCKPFDKTPDKVLIFPTHNGAVMNFVCMSGYKLNGKSSMYCDGKQWQGPVPLCIPSDSKPPTSCDFEREDLCGWQHDLNHDFDWRRMNYNTPSGTIGTGPSYDHTLGKDQGGYYMYIESSSRNENDTARLISPVYEPTKKDVCFEFWYHMYGATTGTLRVYLKKAKEDSNLKSSWVLFDMKGNQGNVWYKSRHFIGPIDDNYQIIIEGVRGASYVSDIAIDDVKIIEDCQNEPETTTTMVSYSTELTPIIETCEDRCGLMAPTLATNNLITCDCDEDCWSRNRCCPDIFDHCIFRSTTEDENELVTTTEETTVRIDTTTIAVTTMPTTTIKLIAPTTPKMVPTVKPTNATIKVVPTTTNKPTTIVKPTTTIKPTTTTLKKSPPTKPRKSLPTKKYVPPPRKTKKPTIPTVSTPPPFYPKLNISKVIYTHPTRKETDYDTMKNQETNESIFDYSDEGEEMVPFLKHYTQKKVITVEEKKSNSYVWWIVGAVTANVVLIAVVVAVKVGMGKYKRRLNGSGDSQSDVRFLTNDEVLDFTMNSDYDDL